MPYIKPEDRSKYEGLVSEMQRSDIQSAGELNYLVTQLVYNFLAFKGESYQSYNDIVGALEGAKLELYRRMIADYEDEKAKINGDVP